MPPARAPLTTLLLGSLLATSAPAALALQRIDARDGVSVEAAIALKEPTRIKIEGAPISDVFGNIYSSNCAVPAAASAIAANAASAPAINPAGEVVLECDKDKGEIYVKPVAPGTKPINLFVSSGKATYTLLLKRVDMHDVIVDRTAPGALRSVRARPVRRRITKAR
jgi:conjugal transfer pilus assembly protein TraK